jgi:hypothetical protein
MSEKRARGSDPIGTDLATELQKGISGRLGKKGMTGKGQPLQTGSPPPKPSDSAESAKPKK